MLLSYPCYSRPLPSQEVAITQNDNIEQAITEALEHLPLESLVRGKLVAVKPNDTWASPEDKTAVTQPDTLQAVLRQVKRFGPRELVVTGGAGAGETDEIFRMVGLMEVVEQEGAMFFDHNRPPFTAVNLEYRPEADVDGPQKSVMVNPRVLEYETLISLAQLRLHETATVTLALKNMAMSYPAADYYGHPRAQQKHQHQFFADMHSFIAARAKRFLIHLASSSAIRRRSAPALLEGTRSRPDWSLPALTRWQPTWWGPSCWGSRPRPCGIFRKLAGSDSAKPTLSTWTSRP